MIGGKTVMGMTLIRPFWVKQYEPWRTIDGPSAQKLFNQEIAWDLLDSKDHWDAVAGIWRAAIDQVKEMRRHAIEENQLPSTEGWLVDSTTENRFAGGHPTLDQLKMFPDPAALGASDYVLTAFQPFNTDWFVHIHDYLSWAEIVRNSGFLDGKPVRFNGIETLGDFDAVVQYALSANTFLKETADRTIHEISDGRLSAPVFIRDRARKYLEDRAHPSSARRASLHWWTPFVAALIMFRDNMGNPQAVSRRDFLLPWQRRPGISPSFHVHTSAAQSA
jgi:hypothetical protein